MIVGFNVTVFAKLIDMVSGSTLQLTFKRVPFVEFWCNIKEERSQGSEKPITKLFSLFQLHF